MIVVIDESGCPGFKFTRGSDPVFGLGMVIFESGEAAQHTEQALREIRARTRHKTEFKFAKCSDDIRDAYFDGVASCPFSVRAIIVRKDILHSRQLRNVSDSFYSYFVKQLMKFDNGALMGARVRIDGSGGRDFQRSLNTYLRRELGDRIKDVKMVDSERDPLIQLADMCIGAITRSERERHHADRWRAKLKPRIADVWNFG